jgi:riboflavin kinase/FMN adenylyltransferase
MISSLSRRVELLVQAGAEDVLVTPFTPAVADLEAADWAAGVLMPIGTQHVVVGEGFRFGYRRAGDAAMLRRMRFSVEEVPLQGGVSSSRVRELLAAGNLTAAQRRLGRPVELEGVAIARALETTTSTARDAVRADAGMALPPTGIYGARLARADARVFVRDGRVDLLAPADAAPLQGMRVCVRLTAATATFRRRRAGVAVRGGRDVSIARAA